MTYDLDVRKEALDDLLDAIDWYDRRREGLGDELFLAVETAKAVIKRNPFQFEDRYNGIRQVKTNRFPYIIFYKIEDKTIVIIAILHAHRSVGVWRKRIK